MKKIMCHFRFMCLIYGITLVLSCESPNQPTNSNPNGNDSSNYFFDIPTPKAHCDLGEPVFTDFSYEISRFDTTSQELVCLKDTCEWTDVVSQDSSIKFNYPEAQYYADSTSILLSFANDSNFAKIGNTKKISSPVKSEDTPALGHNFIFEKEIFGITESKWVSGTAYKIGNFLLLKIGEHGGWGWRAVAVYQKRP